MGRIVKAKNTDLQITFDLICRQIIQEAITRIFQVKMSVTMDGIPSSEITSGLSSLRDEGLLHDVELEAQGKRIKTHKVVLAAASPYFKALFTGKFKEAKQKVVTLKEIDFESLSTIIDCFYTPGLVLTNENISGILAAAHIFQISTIIRQCETFIENNLSEATCFTFLRLAETFNHKAVVTKATQCILENFIRVRHMDEFKKISKGALVQYITDDLLNVRGDESEVYYAIKDWLEYSEDRMQYAAEIIGTVRFKLVKVDKLNEIASMPLIDDHKEGRMLVRNALSYHAKPFEKPLVYDDQCKPRGKQGFLVLDNSYGPLDNWTSSNKITASVCHIHNWKTWNPSVDGLGLFVMGSMTAVQINNFFFLFAVDQELLMPVAKRFDASSGEWINLPPVPQKATVGACAVRFEDQIFLFGGMYVKKTSEFAYREEFSAIAFSYNIGTNSWVKLPDVPQKICEAAATSCAIDACVYVSGGYAENDTTAVSTVFAYDTKAKLWLTKLSMNHMRGEHCMEALGDKIFVFGGAEDCSISYSDMVPQIEMFDVISEQWTDIVGQQLRLVQSSCKIAENGEILNV